MEPTPATEIDDPLRQAAINSARQQQIDAAPVITRPGLNRRTDTSTSVKFTETKSQALISSGLAGDLEKGSIAIEEERMQATGVSRPATPKPGAAGHDRERHKAVVRVEIHDTGVGLRKQDVIE